MLKVELSAEDYARLEKLQGLLSHRGQDKAGTLAGVLAVLIEEGLDKHDPVRIEARSERRRAALLGAAQVMSTATEQKTESPAPVAGSSRHIPAAVKRRVWLRDSGKCTEPGCGATRFLHFDHAQPFALGGGHIAENLHLLCSAHHGRATLEAFGPRPHHDGKVRATKIRSTGSR